MVNPLIQAGRWLGVTSLLTGQWHEVFQSEVNRYARHLARINRQDGHAGFQLRFNRLNKLTDLYIAEVTAESWPDQNDIDAAYEMFNAWKQSPGHWSVVDHECVFYGYAMARGRDTWYAVGIIGW
jgi:hypothetical protein